MPRTTAGRSHSHPWVMKEAGRQNSMGNTGKKESFHGNAFNKNWVFNGNRKQMHLLRDRNVGPEITKNIPKQISMVHSEEAHV